MMKEMWDDRDKEKRIYDFESGEPDFSLCFGDDIEEHRAITDNNKHCQVNPTVNVWRCKMRLEKHFLLSYMLEQKDAGSTFLTSKISWSSLKFKCEPVNRQYAIYT